jgi:hypothetical protein
VCIIVDTCVLACVFDATTDKHSEFRPVLLWIMNGAGKVLYGGTEYKDDIPQKYRKLFLELTKSGKTCLLDDKVVDDWATKLKQKITSKKFDDPHLVAMVIVSRCQLVATDDHGAKKYLKMKSLYPKAVKRPKIYSGLANSGLLNQKNIIALCQ